MSWYNEALLAAGTAFLCAALILSWLAIARHSKYSLGQRLGRWKDRRKRIRKETYYLMTRGTHSREEEGVRKYYRTGDVVGFSDEEYEKYGKDRTFGPIDIKKWRKLHKGRREGSDSLEPRD